MKAKEFILENKAGEPLKPRNFVAKNAQKITSGAGAHKDKKRAEKQGDVKHKKQAVPMEGAAGAKPGWMLKQDPKLAAKVKAKTDLAKKRQASYGDPGAGKSVDKKGVAEVFDSEELANEVYAEFERIYPNLARRSNERTVHAAIMDVLNYGDDSNPSALAQDVARAVKQQLQSRVSEEQVTELSSELLGRYKKAAGADARAADAKKDYKHGDKRFSGIVKATKKQFANDMKKYSTNEDVISEKAVSKQQQKFMGMVHAAKKGETPASPEVAKVAKGMSKKAAKDFASTKHKGLPTKKTD